MTSCPRSPLLEVRRLHRPFGLATHDERDQLLVGVQAFGSRLSILDRELRLTSIPPDDSPFLLRLISQRIRRLRMSRSATSVRTRCGHVGSNRFRWQRQAADSRKRRSTRVKGGRPACSNDARLHHEFIEPKLIEDIRDAIEESQRRLRPRFREMQQPRRVTDAKIRQAKRTIANVISKPFRKAAIAVPLASPSGYAKQSTSCRDCNPNRRRAIRAPKLEQLVKGLCGRTSR